MDRALRRLHHGRIFPRPRRHALIVVDDLTKHAATHREIALLTRQPPGREAYPGDVFYVHARLLERAAKLSAARGGGSLTALPIAETDAGNLSAYIPTNLISITDGQIVLDARLFNEGRKPAVDVGLCVSRVGGKTQAPALRDAAERLRLDYAQFLELEMFTRFGGMPDARVRGAVDARRAHPRAARPAALRAAAARRRDRRWSSPCSRALLDPLPLDAVAAFRARPARGARPRVPRGADRRTARSRRDAASCRATTRRACAPTSPRRERAPRAAGGA